MDTSWSRLPLSIDPVLWQGDFFSLAWYGLAFALGVSVALWYFRYILLPAQKFFSVLDYADIVLWGLVGTLLGARLGFVLVYGDDSYWQESWRIISPYDVHDKIWTGIRGMSFFGGVVGGGLGWWWLARRRHWPFFRLTDMLVQIIPIALGFGRLGNFLGRELIGRATEVPWGMYFPSDPTVLRHPSQLYEAFGEGLVLYWLLRLAASHKVLKPGWLTSFFLIGYGVIRFALEFFRAPDRGSPLIFSWLTLNQVLAAGLSVIGTLLFLSFWRRDTIELSKFKL